MATHNARIMKRVRTVAVIASSNYHQETSQGHRVDVEHGLEGKLMNATHAANREPLLFSPQILCYQAT